MARNCRFPDLETYGSQPGNQRLPLQGIAGSQKLEFMFSKLSGYHCKIPIWCPWLSSHTLTPKFSQSNFQICQFTSFIMFYPVGTLGSEHQFHPSAHQKNILNISGCYVSVRAEIPGLSPKGHTTWGLYI